MIERTCVLSVENHLLLYKQYSFHGYWDTLKHTWPVDIYHILILTAQ